LGAPFAYAAFNKERTLALGIPSFEEMKHLYHYPHVNAQTQVFGVIGDPVGHSLSPAIHNAALRKLGINAAYLPFRVPRGELKTFLEQFERVPVRGYSVTIPHKEVALALAKHKDETATRLGAANTLVRDTDGFAAFNTDYQAALDSLRAHAPSGNTAGFSWSGKRALILGAGGVARAIAYLLAREGTQLVIANRTQERASDLAEDVGCKFVAW